MTQAVEALQMEKSGREWRDTEENTDGGREEGEKKAKEPRSLNFESRKGSHAHGLCSR